MPTSRSPGPGSWPIVVRPETSRDRVRLRTAGFTLAEILIVLLLISLLSVLAAPKLDVSGVRTDGAMRSVGSTLLAAQRAAVTRQHAVVVAFDEANRGIRIHYDRDNDTRLGAREPISLEPLEAGVRFGRGGAAQDAVAGAGPVSFRFRQDGLPAVVFHRNGSASEEGGVYLTSARAARESGHERDTRLVVVDRATGRPSWSAYDGARWKREF